MSVNEKIRSIREAKGLTQEQVAEKLGICVNSYGDIERGDSDIKLSRLEKIAEVFEIRLSELFELNEKSAINIAYKKNKDCNWYLNSSAIELEKQQLINELKDKEIALQQREIEHLNEIIALMKKNSI